jgi:tRNA (cytidine/uridine-2'-O-)-methyltransferase
MDVALFQPDIPQNTAAILRTARCLDAAVHIVGPAAFDLSDRAVRRAGLDYAAAARLVRHVDWDAFRTDIAAERRRIVLFTTRGTTPVDRFPFEAGDVLLFGRESAGVPDEVQAACPAVRIPLAPGARSLNLAVAVGIGLFEAMRVAGTLPESSAA